MGIFWIWNYSSCLSLTHLSSLPFLQFNYSPISFKATLWNLKSLLPFLSLCQVDPGHLLTGLVLSPSEGFSCVSLFLSSKLFSKLTNGGLKMMPLVVLEPPMASRCMETEFWTFTHNPQDASLPGSHLTILPQFLAPPHKPDSSALVLFDT